MLQYTGKVTAAFMYDKPGRRLSCLPETLRLNGVLSGNFFPRGGGKLKIHWPPIRWVEKFQSVRT